MKRNVHILAGIAAAVVTVTAGAAEFSTTGNLKASQAAADGVSPELRAGATLQQQGAAELPAVQKNHGKLKESGVRPRKGNALPAVQQGNPRARELPAVQQHGLKENALPAVQQRRLDGASTKGLGTRIGDPARNAEPIDGDAPALPADALPEDAGRPEIGSAVTGGGFAAGSIASCGGPDPVPWVQVRRLRSPEGGPYNFWLAVYVENKGRATFDSRRDQTLLTVRDGGATMSSGTWPSGAGDTVNLPPGEFVSRVLTIEDWQGTSSEFTTPIEVAISYDPDIHMDGNPDNDDCAMRNNRITISAAEIERRLLSGLGWR